jgi:membrane protein implicated in regulation of membrane protease activity
VCHLILFLPAFGLSVFWIFPLDIALTLYLLILGISLLLYFKIFQAMRQRVKTGEEGMLGKKGVVFRDLGCVYQRNEFNKRGESKNLWI